MIRLFLLAISLSGGICIRSPTADDEWRRVIQTCPSFALDQRATATSVLSDLRGGGDASPERTPIARVLRVRGIDGSMKRLKVDDESLENMTIEELLLSLGIEGSDNKETTISLDSTPITSATTTSLKELTWKHGSLLSVSLASASESLQRKAKSTQPPVFHPYPALAKDYTRRHSGGRRRSYSDRLHTVEAQPHGPIARLLLCDAATRQFHSQASSSSDTSYGILLGTYGRERKEPRGTHQRTSLSTLPSADEYCAVAKVHAIWTTEDPLVALQDPRAPWRVLAEQLGLQPVGWIFAYPGDRSAGKDDDDDESDPVPIHATDATLACRLQAAVMEQQQQQRSPNTEVSYPGFCTAAMSATTGATEAFQLSDVAVQMVAEGVWKDEDDESPQLVRTNPPILVDDRETSSLDIVLCLMNTALLRHTGRYTVAKPVGNKRGRLTKRGRKQLLQALDDADEHGPCPVLPLLADFHVLMAVLPMLDDDDDDEDCRNELVGLVRKWAQGQKKSTRLSGALVSRLRAALKAYS